MQAVEHYRHERQAGLRYGEFELRGDNGNRKFRWMEAPKQPFVHVIASYQDKGVVKKRIMSIYRTEP